MCNKIDLKDDRQVTTQEGQEMADKYDVDYYEVSAKTGENVEKVF